MKPIRFLGDALKRLRAFPPDARQDAGYQLNLVQQGITPVDFKPMPSIGLGVAEIRVWDGGGTYRVIYMARLAEAGYGAARLPEKDPATAKADISLAKARYTQRLRGET